MIRGVVVVPAMRRVGACGLTAAYLYPLVAALFLLGAPASADEDSVSDQLWFNYILAFPRSEKLYLEVDFEAAAQVSGGDPWGYLYTTGLAEYYITRYVDLTGELLGGYTEQRVGEDSFEIAGRFGFRVHLLSPVLDHFGWERVPSGRIGLANLARIEPRKFWYDSGRPSSSDARFRNRIELRAALNREMMSADGVWVLLTDYEIFWNIGGSEASEERFSTKTRWRIGVDYRHSYRWRYSLLFQRDKARDTLDEPFDVDAYALDFRIKMFF